MATPSPSDRTRPAPQRAVATPAARARIAAQRLRRSDLRVVPVIVLGALLLLPAVVTENWQFVVLILSVVGAGTAYIRSPTAGLVAIVALWTFLPLARRLLDYFIDTRVGPDLLSLAPFFATLIVGVLAFERARARRSVLIVLACVWAGLLWGVPLGVDDPFALLFALFSYVAGSVALLVGYHDWKRGALVLERILLVIVPIVAGYAIYQFLADALPPWDQLWLETKAPISTGSKQTNDFRAFSVMNSPGLLAGTMALFTVMLVVGRRIDPLRLFAGGAAMAALAFTQVRSAWVALGIALVLLAPISRGAALVRIAVLIVALGGIYVALGSSDAGKAVVSRATTLADAGDDGSVKARIDAVTEFGPKAVLQPLGDGLGSAGQAARVSLKGKPPFVDNGYLTIIWQVGLLGFLLIHGAIVGGALYGSRNLNRYRRGDRLPLLAILIAVAVLHLSGDMLFGLPAVIFWYCLGALIASSEDPGCTAVTTRRRAARQAPAPPRPPMGIPTPAPSSGSIG